MKPTAAEGLASRSGMKGQFYESAILRWPVPTPPPTFSFQGISHMKLCPLKFLLLDFIIKCLTCIFPKLYPSLASNTASRAWRQTSNPTLLAEVSPALPVVRRLPSLLTFRISSPSGEMPHPLGSCFFLSTEIRPGKELF